uniref:Tubby C-terminal domain-containing protein n=1 Tax=Ditylenchus dipsaci TaxID=166011 RepID=A0A915CN96_9BILA
MGAASSSGHGKIGGTNSVGSCQVPPLQMEFVGGAASQEQQQQTANLAPLPSSNVSSLRAQVRDIARQVAQFEERIKINSLLNEIRSDLRQRVQHIKTVLGESGSEEGESLLLNTPCSSARLEHSLMPPTAGGGKRESKSGRRNCSSLSSASGINSKMLVMTNKTPFWNEQSQVYQLDFNGRVTQESAKNFQIEHQSRQCLFWLNFGIPPAVNFGIPSSQLRYTPSSQLRYTPSSQLRDISLHCLYKTMRIALASCLLKVRAATSTNLIFARTARAQVGKKRRNAMQECMYQLLFNC